MCRIDVQGKINVHVGKFFGNIKGAGQNKGAGGNFFLKINKCADQNKTVPGEFFLKSTTAPLPMETIKEFPKHIQSILRALPKHSQKHSQTTLKQSSVFFDIYRMLVDKFYV